jgi:hypothetical protein
MAEVGAETITIQQVALVVLVVALEEMAELQEVQLKVQEQVLLDLVLMEETLRALVTVAQAEVVAQAQREQMERVMAASQEKAEAQAEQVMLVSLHGFLQLHL